MLSHYNNAKIIRRTKDLQAYVLSRVKATRNKILLIVMMILFLV